ncbi:histidine phosphotransferase family protein [Pseudoroseicyclus sp. H15]
MTRALDLAALVGSRICHDLISPLGAIGNGVELMGMSGRMDGPEMELIGESVEAANARLRFFRIAFGSASAGAVISRSEIVSTLAAVSRSGRIGYEWGVEGEVQRREVKVIFLLLQCLETAMPFGGDIGITRNEVGRWRLSAEGRDMRIADDLWESLQGRPARVDPSPGTVQFLLVPEVMEAFDLSLALKLGEGRIIAQF